MKFYLHKSIKITVEKFRISNASESTKVYNY